MRLRRRDGQGHLNAYHSGRRVDGWYAFGASMVAGVSEAFLEWLSTRPAVDTSEPNPLREATIAALGVCRNCLCTDCGCCPGCAAVNADVDGTYHGSPGCC